MKHLLESILLNYKMWICFIVALYLIEPRNIIHSFFILLLGIALVHNAHYLLHLECLYPFNIVHIYHHTHTNWFSHLIELALEFYLVLFVIAIKYICQFLYTIEINLFPEWIVAFFYIYYTTHHNINYSLFHVNHVHETHHKLLVKNLGPDIADIVFGTKHDPDHDIENTDHTIPNIIFALISVLCLKRLAKYKWFDYLFGFTYGIVVCILVFASAYLYLQETREYLDRDLEKFISV